MYVYLVYDRDVSLLSTCPLSLLLPSYPCPPPSLPVLPYSPPPSSADQDECFRSLENMLVCMRHCCEELRKTRGPRVMSVVYLHQFQYHVLLQALRYFQEDVTPEGAGYVPTLPSSTQPPGNIHVYTCMYTTAHVCSHT